MRILVFCVFLLLCASFVSALDISVIPSTDHYVRYVSPDDKTPFSVSAANHWNNLINFPAGCPAGQAISVIGKTLTCISVGTGGSGVADQNLNTYNDVNFNTVTANFFIGDGSLLTGIDFIDTNCGVYGSCSSIVYLNDFNSLGDLRYYPLNSNPAGYLTTAVLSGYVPYQAGTADLNLGSHTIMVNGVASGGFPLYSGGNKITPTGIEGTQLTIHGNSYLGQNGSGLITSSILYGAWSLNGEALYFSADNTSDIGTSSNTAKNIYTRKLCDSTNCYTVSDLNFVSSITDTNCAVTHSCANVLYSGDVNSFSGNYSDLNGKPYIPTENNIDLNALGVINSLDLNNSLNYLKTSSDTNCSVYGSCSLVMYQQDANAWFVFKTDLNNLGDVRWIKISDFNTYGDARYSLLGHNHNSLYYLKSEVDANFGNYYTKSQSDANWNKYVKITDFNSNLSPQSCPAGQALRILGATPTCIAVGGSGTDTNESTANRVDANGVRLLDFNFGLKSLFNANDVNAQRFCFNNGTCTTSWTSGFTNPATTDLNMNFYNIINVDSITDSNKFGEFITIKDDSPFARDGYVDIYSYSYSKSVVQVVGKLNEGTSFNIENGTIYQVNDFNNDFAVNAFTLSTWVKTTSNTANMRLINGISFGSVYLYLNFLGATGKASVIYLTTGPTYNTATSVKDVNDGNWHLVTGTWNGTNLIIYIDGNVDTNVVTGTTPLPLGVIKWSIGNDSYFGQADDIGLWSRALTPSQVSALWNNGVGSAINNSDTNLEFVYHLDDLTRKRVDFPTGINAVDLNVGDIVARNGYIGYITSNNVCYSDGTNCTGVNPFDQSLNSDEGVSFDSVTSENDISTNNGIYYAQSNAGLSDCYDSSLGGQVCSTGGIVTTITDDPSDANFKIGVKNLSLDLNKFSSIVPAEWTWSPTSAISKSGEGYGFVAQDLILVYPQLVMNGQKKQLTGYTSVVDINGVLRKIPIWKTTTYKTIDYAGIIALQVKQIQELKNQNALLKQCAIDSKTYTDYQNCVKIG